MKLGQLTPWFRVMFSFIISSPFAGALIHRASLPKTINSNGKGEDRIFAHPVKPIISSGR